MTSRERVLSAFERKGYDRIPVKHEGTPEINQMIMDHYGLSNMEQLLRVVGDDFRYVEPDYIGPELRKFPDGSVEGYWGERYKYADFKGGKYLEIMDARFKFYFDMHERMLQESGGLIDFTHIGEDLGTQSAQVISFETFDRLFAPKFEKYFSMVHSYGARSMMHMCGCVRAFLPRLIELGLDVYDVVQPTTPDMDIEVLQKNFGKNLSFCGSVCVQTTIAFGSPEEVENEVQRRLELFPEGGMFLGPSHAIQVGSPMDNIISLYRSAGSLREVIDDSILSIQEDSSPDEINMSKLF